MFWLAVGTMIGIDITGLVLLYSHTTERDGGKEGGGREGGREWVNERMSE